MFKRSGVMGRCVEMSGTWSGVLYIDLEIKNYLIVILQGVVLKLLVADQAQHAMIDVKESYRRFPDSVSHWKNVQFHILNDRNHILLLKNIFTKQCKIVINRFFDLKRILSFSMWQSDNILSLQWLYMSQHVVKHVFPWVYTEICDYLILNWVI